MSSSSFLTRELKTSRLVSPSLSLSSTFLSFAQARQRSIRRDVYVVAFAAGVSVADGAKSQGRRGCWSGGGRGDRHRRGVADVVRATERGRAR